ncbi:Fcf1-domain-containing protein [Xylaria sp. FL0043]|nr:Fcf1-domain-containing protein [Xylaria sp. FL0043]
MPRAKRSKQYKRLMNQYEINFGFREPYQVLCDSQFLEAAIRSKMDIDHILKGTLHGHTKLLITQCSMRWLYARKNEPSVGAVIDFAKEKVERRRCGHHPSDYPEPLAEVNCLHSVVDPSKNGINKHRYVCAINDDEIRSSLRNGIQVVPLLYIRRSVLIMEPASSTTVKARSRDEKAKYTAELKLLGGKRKRQQEDTDDDDGDRKKERTDPSKPEKKKTKKAYGRKEPNPLSVKKKKEQKPQHAGKAATETDETAELEEAKPDNGAQVEAAGEASGRKRRRKHKSKSASAGGGGGDDDGGGGNNRADDVQAQAAEASVGDE